jgi:bacillithiol synthase
MSLTSEIPLRSIPGFNKMVSEYLIGNEALRHLYRYEFNIDAFGQVIADKSKDNTDRELLVSVLKRQYDGISMSGLTAANIELLLSPNTYTVTAAHQPCVLLGPAFNIYKIASAVNLASQLKAQYPAYNFVPVFWMGSEDHDFEELGSTYIYGKKIEWPAAEGEGGAYGRRQLAGFDKVLDEALAITGEAGKTIIEKLRAGLVKFETFGPYTRYLVNELFADTGLVVIDQDDAALKTRFAPVIKDEILHSSAFRASAEAVRWLQENYSVQATPREINLFYLSENSRERIIKTSDGYEVNNTALKFTEAALLAEVAEHPERFSPNVILRPVYQELILPNLAFIGGAGELSYWMELKGVFDYHKVNFPVLVMRSSMTMINAGIEKKMSKLGISAVDLFGNPDQFINSYIKAKLSDDIQFEAEKNAMAMLFDSFEEKAEKVDPTLKAAVLAEKQKQLNALDALEGRIVKAEKRKQEDTVNQIKALFQTFVPQSSWQERIENFIPFYLKDPDFVKNAVELADPFQRAMLIVNQDSN